MSSHHSQGSINLHHDQVTAGKARRLQRQADRRSAFLAMREQFRFEHNFVLVMEFICFAYTAIATSVYMGYIIL